MNVIQVAPIVQFVTNGVFPIAALPDTPFSFALAAFGNTFASFYAPGKPRLYQTPTSGEIAVFFLHLPQAMQMVWQHDGGDDCEWVILPGLPESAA
jgi:hypothetical protein